MDTHDEEISFPPVSQEVEALLDTSQKAPVAMFETMAKHHTATGEQVTLVATGCLTNVALMLSLYPEAKSVIDNIVIMGGSTGRGNTGVMAEFNIELDPEAAAIVFELGIPVVMVPLDVTHTALVTSDVLARIESKPTPFRKLVTSLMLFFAASYRDHFGFLSGPPLHDPCALAYVLRPDLFRTVLCRVDIETTSRLTAGQTVCDLGNVMKYPPERLNGRVAVAMDVEAFWGVFLAALDAVDATTPMNEL